LISACADGTATRAHDLRRRRDERGRPESLATPTTPTNAFHDSVPPTFCPSGAGAGIAFADLTVPSPAFVNVSQPEVETLNPLVAAMIR